MYTTPSHNALERSARSTAYSDYDKNDTNNKNNPDNMINVSQKSRHTLCFISPCMMIETIPNQCNRFYLRFFLIGYSVIFLVLFFSIMSHCWKTKQHSWQQYVINNMDNKKDQVTGMDCNVSQIIRSIDNLSCPRKNRRIILIWKTRN